MHGCDVESTVHHHHGAHVGMDAGGHEGGGTGCGSLGDCMAERSVWHSALALALCDTSTSALKQSVHQRQNLKQTSGTQTC